MNVCEILPNLWLGNIKIAQTLSFYSDHNVDCVINCSKDLPFYNEKCKNIRVSVHDNLKKEEIERLFDYFDTCSDFINIHLKQNSTILVHCYAGKQRSASIILAYLMKYANINLYDGVNLIQSKRFQAFTPGINFISSLEKYEKYIKNKNN